LEETLLLTFKPITQPPMKILPFQAVYPVLEKFPHSNDFFNTVKSQYTDYRADGLFKSTDKEAVYIYRITTTDGEKFTGLVSCVDITDFLNGNIKKHEKTIAKSEEMQSDLIEKRGSAIKPVLLTYPSLSKSSSFWTNETQENHSAVLQDLLFKYIENHKKFYIIHIGGEKHCFWQISEPEVIQQIQSIFETEIPHAYIADGHHRSASFENLHNKLKSPKTAKMLCAFFPEQDLRIHSFNRIVSDLNGMTQDEFLSELTHFFKVKVLKKGVKPYAKFEMTMLLDGKWFQLNWRKAELKEFGSDLVLLDVHLLNEQILKPLLGVKNIREDVRVKYMEGTKSIASLEEACPTEGVAFCLFPVEFADMKEIADSNGILPPKSTFFEPRMKNGLLIYDIN
jgi:uncharacterized protein (DUF1015 family)